MLVLVTMHIFHRWLIFVFLVLVCAACSDNQPPKGDSDSTYIATVDLAGIQRHGSLRLIAPRFDSANMLPRSGIPVLSYQAIAEQFANSLGVEPRWLYVDGFEQLIPALNGGRGDVIVTNLTVTKHRQQQLSFTIPIDKISEVLVVRQEFRVEEPNDLGGLRIAATAGTAHLETLKELNVSGFEIEVLESASNDGDVLAGVSAGKYGAAIMDSNIAGTLLTDYPQLKISLSLNKNRDIAWAVRQENPDLLRALNEFFVSHHIKTSAKINDLRDWTAINQKGRLRMLTLNNPASYFMYRGELMGFDYELMRDFAKEHHLNLVVVLKDSIPELFAALKNGEGDVIAASLTKTESRRDEGIEFSEPYLFVSEQLVGLAGGPKATQPEALAGYRVGVNPDTVFYQKLKKLNKERKIGFKLVEINDAMTEELIARLEEDEFDFTVSDSHLVAMEKTYHQNTQVNFNLTDEVKISWAIRPDQVQLKAELNKYIKKKYRGLFYNITATKYFKSSKRIQKYQSGRVTAGSALSPYDEIIKPLAKENAMDWRLVVAQMYQESKFDPNAKSFAGARGLMQLMPRTAKELGFENLFEPENGIAAGVAYMHWLSKRFGEKLDFQERIYFALAAYNAGIGHVQDARRLASKLQYDSNKWFDHVEKAMLLLAKPQYYKQARYGYVRGSEPVKYVREIRQRYMAYLDVE